MPASIETIAALAADPDALVAIGAIAAGEDWERLLEPTIDTEALEKLLEPRIAAVTSWRWRDELEPLLAAGAPQPDLASKAWSRSAHAWRSADFKPEGTVVEIHPSDLSPAAIPAALDAMSPATEVEYVRLRGQALPKDYDWRWPWRLAFLPDRLSRTWMDALVGDGAAGLPDWFDRLVQVEALGQSTAACDLLVIPSPDLLPMIERSRGLRAGAVLMFVESETALDELMTSFGPDGLADVFARLGCTQIAITLQPFSPIEDPQNVYSLIPIVEQVSHNASLGRAFTWAFGPGMPWHRGRRPIIIASAELHLQGRISEVIKDIARRVRAMPMEQLERAVGPKLDALREMAGRLESIVDELAYDHESGPASDVADPGREMSEAIEATETDLAASRFLQAQVLLEDTAGGELSLTQGFVAGATHAVRVRVGPGASDWLSVDQPFPDEALPPEDIVHSLRVLLWEPEQDLTLEGTLELPRTGSSEACTLELKVPSTASSISAYVILFHRNRCLQVAQLRCEVLADAQTSASGEPLTFEVTEVLRPGLGDLGMRSFGHAMMVNANDRLLVVSEGETDRVLQKTTLPALDLQGFKTKLETLMSGAATSLAGVENEITSPEAVDFLRSLAYQGRTLYSRLSQSSGFKSMAGLERIQVVPVSTEFSFPLELVYDRRAPKADAKLCTGFQQALETGTCPSCEAGPDDGTTVCPLGFWGIRKIIERHPPRDQGNPVHHLTAEPVTDRRHLMPLEQVLLAASDKVDNYDSGAIDDTIDAMRELFGDAKAEFARDWQIWTQKIESLKPGLLVVMPHTLELAGLGAPALEIGNEQNLDLESLDERFVQADDPPIAPIVLLLGCNTANPPIRFQSFVDRFRWNGASIVVGTQIPVLGRNAAPVARAFIRELSNKAVQDGPGFGEVLRTVRRRMLARGIVMALAITAYGDADWLLAPTGD